MEEDKERHAEKLTQLTRKMGEDGERQQATHRDLK